MFSRHWSTEPSVLVVYKEIPTLNLNKSYRLRPGSKLKEFLASFTRLKIFYSLIELTAILTRKIIENHLYDELNDQIIIFNQELTFTFNVRAIHMAELAHLILSQIGHSTRVPLHGDIVKILPSDRFASPALSVPRPLCSIYPTQHFSLSKNPRYLLRSLDKSITNRTVFKFQQILHLTLRYIRTNLSEFSVHGTEILYCKGSEFSKAFGSIRYLHRAQVEALVTRQVKKPIPAFCIKFRGKCIIHHHFQPAETSVSYWEEFGNS